MRTPNGTFPFTPLRGKGHSQQERSSSPVTPRSKKQRVAWNDARRFGGGFLKGPIQVSWLARAHALGSNACTIGLECWRVAGCARSQAFRLNLSRVRVAPGMSRTSARRGLRQLEEAGLVSVARIPGQRSLVAIVPIREPAIGEAPPPDPSPRECTIQAASVQETEGQRNGRGDLRDHVGSI